MPPPRWESPFLPISSGIKDNSSRANDKSEEISTTRKVMVPHSGLYGLTFGSIQNNSPFESYLLSEHNSDSFNDKNYGNRNEDRFCNEKKDKNGKEKINIWKKTELDIHCGCTFQAIFTNNNNIGINSTRITIPLPLSCKIGNPSDIDSSAQSNKVLSSTKVARIIYLSAGTCVSVDRVTSCYEVSSSSTIENDAPIKVASCAREGNRTNDWKWKLILHRMATNAHTKYTSTMMSDSTKQDGNINVEKKEVGLEEEAQKEHFLIQSTISDINSRIRKKSRINGKDIDCPRGHINNHEIISENDMNSREHMHYVDFYPKQVMAKPFLCTICRRKFSTVLSIQHHYKSAHLHENNVSGSGNYSNNNEGQRQQLEEIIEYKEMLAGPSILRKPLKVVYEDDVMVVVVKPQGIPTMGDRWTLSKSDLFLKFRAPKGVKGALNKPVAVHRLDSATGGLLVIAKTKPVERKLKLCFADRVCQKRYRAIVFGKLEAKYFHLRNDNQNNGGVSSDNLYRNSSCNITTSNGYYESRGDVGTNNIKKNTVTGEVFSGMIDLPIDSKPAITKFNIISYSPSPHPEAKGWITTVDLYPVTGRKHQLRRHMKLVGHGIWGDARYGPYRNKSSRCDSNEKRQLECNLRGERAADDKSKDTAYEGRFEIDENQVEMDSDNDPEEDIKASHTFLYNDDRKYICSSDWSLLENAKVEEYPHIKLCLWALEITFPHPSSSFEGNPKVFGEETDCYVTAKIDEPQWYSDLRADQKKRWLGINKK